MFTSRTLAPLLLVNVIAALGFRIVLPLAPYYAAEFGEGPLALALLTAMYAICALLAGPVLSQLSDRQECRPSIASLLSQAAGEQQIVRTCTVA